MEEDDNNFDKHYGSWYNIRICVSCKKRVLNYARHYNNGVCPHCGNNDEITIVKTEDIIVREIKYTHKYWWKFWITKKPAYEGKDEKAKKWLEGDL